MKACPYHSTLENGMRLYGPKHPCFTVYDTPQGSPKWVDMFGIAPDFIGGQDVNQYLDESRGEA